MDSWFELSNFCKLGISVNFEKITLTDTSNEVIITKAFFNKLASAFKLVCKRKTSKYPLKIDPTSKVALEIYEENALIFGLNGSIIIDKGIVEEIAILIYNYLCKSIETDRKSVLLSNFIVLIVNSVDTNREKLIIDLIKKSEIKQVSKLINIAKEAGVINDLDDQESFQIISENCNMISLLVFCGRVKQENDKV